MALDLPLDRIAALCREYGVLELDVFGSVARGEAGGRSQAGRAVSGDPRS